MNLEAWIDLPNVKGVLWTGMPGAEYGPALVDVLFGDYNPGGKLVFTLAKNDADFGTDISTTYDSNYTEGVFLDYRHQMRSYTNFGNSGLYDPAYEITFTLTNTGNVDGSEVPQLYLGLPAEAGQPPKVLRGFKRVYLLRVYQKFVSRFYLAV